jgi:hypothetical protein
MVRLMSAVLCVLMLWSGAGRADPSATPICSALATG